MAYEVLLYYDPGTYLELLWFVEGKKSRYKKQILKSQLIEN